MGIYYAWTCDAKRETLHVLGHENCKLPTVALDTLAVLADLCHHGAWQFEAVRLVSDAAADFWDKDDAWHHRPQPTDLAECIARVNQWRAEYAPEQPHITTEADRDEE